MRTIVLLVYLQVMLSVVYFVWTVGNKIPLQCMKNRVGDINLQSGIKINHPQRTAKVILNLNSDMRLCEVKYFIPRMNIP